MPEATSAGAALRWARAAVLGCVVLAFAGTAHVVAGGRMPGLVGTIVTGLMATTVLAALLGRPATTGRIVAIVAGGQAALHGVFTAAGGHGGAAHAHAAAPGTSTAAVPQGTMADALGADRLASQLSTGPGPFDLWIHHRVEDLPTAANLGMALAHLVAAAGLGWWLASGERLVWRLVALMGRQTVATLRTARDRVAGALGPTSRAVAPRPTYLLTARSWADPPPLRSLLLARTVARRGPPPLSS